MMVRFLLYVHKIDQKQFMEIILYFHKRPLVCYELSKENRMRIGKIQILRPFNMSLMGSKVVLCTVEPHRALFA